MLTTFSEHIAKWWTTKGERVEESFAYEGDKYYDIHVDPKDERMKDPEYVKLLAAEKLLYGAVCLKRFKPPIFILVVGNQVAIMHDKNQEQTLPMGRNLRVMQRVFLRPDMVKTPKFRKLKRMNQVKNVLVQMQHSGVRTVTWFFGERGELAESFDLRTILSLFDPEKAMAHGHETGNPKLDVFEPAPDPARRDTVVQPVQA